MENTTQIPVVALKDRVLFPCTVVTFDAGREKSVKAAVCAKGGNVFIVSQKDASDKDYTPDTINTAGTVARVDDVVQIGGSSVRVTVTGLYRARALGFKDGGGFYRAEIQPFPVVADNPEMEEAYFRTLKALLYNVSLISDRITKSVYAELESIRDREALVFRTAQKLYLPAEAAQRILEQTKLTEIYSVTEDYVSREMEISRLERKINASVKKSIDKNQKDYYLREQLKAIHTELGEDEEERDAIEKLIRDRHMPEEAERKALKELSRMSRMASTSPDYNVLRGYIDCLCELPWNVFTSDTENLADAVKALDDDHYGLDKVKERITEYLAVLKLTDGLNAPILCLVGPPGVGKTSIAESVARSLGRKFVRMSLGGVRDEAEIRGHRKTYVGAMPGRIITAIKSAGSVNPVFLLDEVDKLSGDMRGDPASALLEVLDPAQNSSFRDRYLEVPFDLSKALFITTANSLDTIPAPLRDRMEIINIDGYTSEEKREIAKRYLIPKRRKANGLVADDLSFSDGATDEIIAGYTMEAGVRNLERSIDAICRKVAVGKAEGKAGKVKIIASSVAGYLGARRFERGVSAETDEVGAATGLAWTAVGGTTLTVEATAMHGKGDVLLTGKLGDVMKESARAAISFIRSKSDEYGIDGAVFENTDIHIHVPEGATPKDGPSAGITMATAILSAFTQKPVRHDVAMTGEITLRGKVLPIGGLKEKALAAYRAGIKNVIIPEDNIKDVEDIPADVKAKLNFIPVHSADTVFRNAITGL